MSKPLRILVIGAHPDDCELKAGGLTALYRAAGHQVKYVSVTNGEAGHQTRPPAELIATRRSEADEVAALMGIEYDILGNRDGRLLPTLDARFELIALIRRFQPDLILTHRPNDYHPDHGDCPPHCPRDSGAAGQSGDRLSLGPLSASRAISADRGD